MHALWDGLLGQHFDEAEVESKVRQISENASLQSRARKQATSRDIHTLIRQGRSVANEFVYTPEVLWPISVAMNSNRSQLAPIELSDEYLQVAEQRAQYSAALAANWLRHELAGNA